MRGARLKLSTRGRYGLRAMVDLAIHANKRPVSIASIAERQNISENYLEQIISKMKKAGLIRSQRGAMGGYQISRPLQDITVGDIVKVLEGDLTLVNCPALTPGIEDISCDTSDFCVTKYVWQKVNDAVSETFHSITLEDLVNKSKNMNNHKEAKHYE